MEPKEIRSAREALELTRADLASKVGVSERTIDRWEAGDSRVSSAAHKRALVQALAKRKK